MKRNDYANAFDEPERCSGLLLRAHLWLFSSDIYIYFSPSSHLFIFPLHISTMHTDQFGLRSFHSSGIILNSDQRFKAEADIAIYSLYMAQTRKQCQVTVLRPRYWDPWLRVNRLQ